MTKKEFGYYSTDLTKGSHKRVYVICSECETYRAVMYYAYIKSKSSKCATCSPKMQRGPFNVEYFQAVQVSIAEGMINEIRTFNDFGYYTIDLTYMSSKFIWVICSECRQERLVPMANYMRTTGKCKWCTQLGIVKSDETRQRMSATQQRIPYNKWKAYIPMSGYCEKFNDICRESNRNKYDRRCFICGKLEYENVTKAGKLRKLSVHHVDMDKNQGCNDHEWKLIPVCMSCHKKLHTKRMQSCIEYILEGENGDK